MTFVSSRGHKPYLRLCHLEDTMGIIIKRRDGDEYVYFLYGKKQLYLGRKNNLDGINKEKLLMGINMLDKSMDVKLQKYADSVLTCAKYMGKKDGIVYLNRRRLTLTGYLSKLKQSSMK